MKLKSPYELLHNHPPILIHLKTFGCLSYATSLQTHRTKFAPRARKVVFLGFKEGTRGYILYDLQHHNIFVSRHVVFYETYFPFKTPNTFAPEPENTTLMACPTYYDPHIQPIPSSTTHDRLSPQSHMHPAVDTPQQLVINDQSNLITCHE